MIYILPFVTPRHNREQNVTINSQNFFCLCISFPPVWLPNLTSLGSQLFSMALLFEQQEEDPVPVQFPLISLKKLFLPDNSIETENLYHFGIDERIKAIIHEHLHVFFGSNLVGSSARTRPIQGSPASALSSCPAVPLS